mmetsp:Transcript_9703/g.18872  ORF Transcript_9703/g.18872 Transcript_9703/m.18872 type:complete len:248 (+) Transcript_9703:681-1424(+)
MPRQHDGVGPLQPPLIQLRQDRLNNKMPRKVETLHIPDMDRPISLTRVQVLTAVGHQHMVPAPQVGIGLGSVSKQPPPKPHPRRRHHRRRVGSRIAKLPPRYRDGIAGHRAPVDPPDVVVVVRVVGVLLLVGVGHGDRGGVEAEVDQWRKECRRPVGRLEPGCALVCCRTLPPPLQMYHPHALHVRGQGGLVVESAGGAIQALCILVVQRLQRHCRSCSEAHQRGKHNPTHRPGRPAPPHASRSPLN